MPKLKRAVPAFGLVCAICVLASSAHAQATVYRCPGPPVLYTDSLSAKEAQEKGCRTIEGTPITIVQSQRPRAASSPSGEAAGARGAEGRVDADKQRARDGERRRVLEAELREAEGRLAEAQREYNGGNPERRGDERNFQRFLDRVAELKASINRQEADIQALKREIGNLP
ncbi:MAG: hypothetical protein ABW005_16040 [Burkholderiaceae bacterium]